jgi:hypothetical protein
MKKNDWAGVVLGTIATIFVLSILLMGLNQVLAGTTAGCVSNGCTAGWSGYCTTGNVCSGEGCACTQPAKYHACDCTK